MSGDSGFIHMRGKIRHHRRRVGVRLNFYLGKSDHYSFISRSIGNLFMCYIPCKKYEGYCPMRVSFISVLILFFFGCVEDSGPRTERPSDSSVTDVGQSDGMIADDASPDAASAEDAMAMTDLGMVDAERPVTDSDPTPVVDSCASACERIMECGRQDLFANTEACVSACDRVSEDTVPQNWFDCLGLEGCGLLQLCRLPDPRPMTCDEICTELDACGENPGFDCEAVCEANNADNEFSACGEALYGGVCGVDEFWSCLGGSIFPECVQRCEVGVECNVLRAAGCLQSCIGDVSSEDPLRALRTRQSNQCLRLAGDDCRRIDQCVNPQEQMVINPPTQEEFCNAWNACFEDFFPCEFLWEEIPQEEGTTICVMQQLANGCPPDPGFIFENCFDGEPGPRGPGCNELCEARFTCGDLDAGVEQFDCVRECNQVLEDERDDEVQRLRALFPCGLSDSCESLDSCLELNDPVSSCQGYCARLDECGLAGENCVDTCDAQFFRSRNTAHRACIAEAADCDAMVACDNPAPLDCPRICARVEACGIDRDECLADCDDDLFEDPTNTLVAAACIIGSPTCRGPAPSVNSCRQDASPGLACARYCTAVNDCANDRPGAMTDCFFACGDGFVGAEAVRFAASEQCLIEVDNDMACEVLQDCIPDPVDPDCEGWCDALASCDEDPENCGATCEDDVLSQVRSFQQADCLSGQLQCAEIGECIGDGGVIEAPEVSLAAFCQIWNGCGFQMFGPCEEFYDDRMPEEMKECLINQMSACPNDPFLAFEQCDRGIGDGGSRDVLAACAELCEADALCAAGGEDQSIRECTAECYQTMGAGAEEEQRRLSGFLNCRHALSCEDLAACRSVNSPEEACGNFCASLAGCGLPADECAAACDSGFYRLRNEAHRRCVLDAGDDCVAMAQCGGSDSLPCEYLCDRLDHCGFGNANCVSRCDDEHFQSPIEASRDFACGVTAPRCNGLPSHAISGCDSDTPAGGDCWSFCWARTGCDATHGAAIGECLIACGEGYIGDDALIFQQARSCIETVDPALEGAALCAAMSECIPDAPAPVCDDWCDGVNPCEARDLCADACAQDPLTQLRSVEQVDCVSGAADECAEVSACFETDEPEVAPVPNQNVVCQQYAACGLADFIPCDEILGVGPDRDQLLRCLAANLAPCPQDPFEVFDACLGGLGPVGPDVDYAPACQRLCQAQGMCGDAALSVRSCIDGCMGRLESGRDELQPQLVECRDALDCTRLDGCTSAVFGDACEAPCQQYIDCGGAGFADLNACVDACNQNRQHPRARPNYIEGVVECLDASEEADDMGEGQCAAEGLQCFDPTRRGAGPPECEEVCPLLADCGFLGGLGDCIQGCREADQQNLAENERIRECLFDALEGGRCDDNALQICFEVVGPPRP